MKHIEVTKREILFSAIVLFVMLAVGFFIGEKIQDNASERAEIYIKAVQIDDADKFNYGMKTNIGNALVCGEFSAIEPVGLPELSGEYFALERITEKYVTKTRTVTYTDSNGKTQTRTETYQEWDRVKTEQYLCQEFMIFDAVFSSDKLNLDINNRLSLSGIAHGKVRGGHLYETSSKRYYYYYLPISFDGTMLANLKDNSFYHPSADNRAVSIDVGKDIESVVESAKNSGKVGIVVFWVVWILLTAGAIFAFVYLDNKWLESH